MKKIILLILLIIISIFVILFFYVTDKYDGSSKVRLYIPSNANPSAIHDSLRSALGDDYGSKVFNLWKSFGNDTRASYGSYVINPGERAINIANKIAKGRQTPIKLTVNVARTYDELIDKIADKFEGTPEQFKEAFDSVLVDEAEFTKKATYIAAVVPDTYEFYWNESPSVIVGKLLDYRKKFWNDERRKKSRGLGLTPVEITVLASIVEEESNKKDEQPVIARLYLNRLKKGMKLQADPTVKFALHDFTLRRITSKHLTVDSPYNTYKFIGLPPGPIRLPQKGSIDAVLDAPVNNYIYMCAKDDLSGYHNFTSDYSTHLENARKYAAALNKRGIY